MSAIPDDFAFLSDDIVYDVLQFAFFERLKRKRSYSDTPFGGRWSEIAKAFPEFILLEIPRAEKTKYVIRREEFCATNYSIEESRDVFINGISVNQETEFSEIIDLAPNFYESLIVHTSDTVPKRFLEGLRPQFTNIRWAASSEPMVGEMEFFKLQLRSPHLRILECNSPVLAAPEFTSLIVNLVRKPGFEALRLSPSMFPISGIVVLAAYEAWLQRREREHLRSTICLSISPDDFRGFTAKIPNFFWNQQHEAHFSYSEKHPTAVLYSMLLDYRGSISPGSEVHGKLTMELSTLTC